MKCRRALCGAESILWIVAQLFWIVALALYGSGHHSLDRCILFGAAVGKNKLIANMVSEIEAQAYQRGFTDGLRLASIKVDQSKIGAIIGERTQLTPTEIENLFLEAQTKDTAFALEKGVIHEIASVNLPPGTQLIQLVFQR